MNVCFTWNIQVVTFVLLNDVCIMSVL
jgi:hypothetical protein